jgi:hypothetical protein
MTTIAIDTIENLEIHQGDHYNEVRALETLSRGIHQLYTMIKRRELEFERRCGLNKVVEFSFGIDFDDSRKHLETIACFFHWFGGSVCNFARFVGFILGLEKKLYTRADLGNRDKISTIKKAVDGYVKSVIELENVRVWRNKVGAHPAITDPKVDDNIATLDMSVIFPVTFENRYVVGGLSLMKSDATGSHTSQLPRWSLTEVYESLVPRFWPDFSIPTVDQFQAAVEQPSGPLCDGGDQITVK